MKSISNDNSKVIDIYKFQEGVKSGKYSDSKGVAQLVINGVISPNYSVHIDRHVVSSAGSVVSFAGLLKEHGAENIKISYKEKNIDFNKLRLERRK